MNILICPDSFKDSLDSQAICEVLLTEIKNIKHFINVVSLPMADGGEGTLDIIYSTGGFERIKSIAKDPLGRMISTSYLWNKKSETVIIEMAQASGIERLTLEERNCLYTTTYGTGMQIVDAITKFNPQKVILTVGSSATNDAGLGMLSALGCEVIGEMGKVLEMPVGAELIKVKALVQNIDFEKLVEGVEFIIVNDVDNPFSGMNGAAHTYANQKGASYEEILMLEKGLINIRDLVISDKNINLDEVKGAGAAGGLAGGAYAYLSAKMISGASFVSEVSRLEEGIAQSDLVITGEGRLDHQTLYGKLVYHVYRICKIYQKKMIVICGSNNLSDQELEQIGNPKVYALNNYNLEAYTDETTKRDLKIVMRDILKTL